MKKLLISCSALLMLMSYGAANALDRVSKKLWQDHQAAQQEIIKLWHVEAMPDDFKSAFSKLIRAELTLMGGGHARILDKRFIGSAIKKAKNMEGEIDYLKAAYLLMKAKVTTKIGKRLEVNDIFKGKRFSVYYARPQTNQKSMGSRQGGQIQ